MLCSGRLKWPLWAELNNCVHSGRASKDCCRLLPQPWVQAARQPVRCWPASMNPCQTPDATLGGPASCGWGRELLEQPPPPSVALRQPQTASLCSHVQRHWESLSVASYIFIIREDVDVLTVLKKWIKLRRLYLGSAWICACIFACFLW